MAAEGAVDARPLTDAPAAAGAAASPWAVVTAHPRAWLYGVLLALAAVPRLWAMWIDQGVFWPDEIYQTLEQGHRLAFGYGMVPWEFRDGARSWLFPGVLGGVMKLAALLGFDSGPGVVHAAKTFMVLLAVWATWAAMRLGERIGGRSGALLAGAFAALFPASIVFGSRCMTEMASAPLLATAAVLLLDGGWRRALAAGFVACVAIFCRYQNGLLAVGFFFLPLFTRRWRDTLAYAGAGALTGVLGGALDRLTWGTWWQSFRVYAKFNLLEGHSSEWGTSEASYYYHCLVDSTGALVAAMLALGLFWSFARVRVVPLTVIAYVAAHHFIPHKEFRFVMPIVPLVLGLAGGGIGFVFERVKRGGWWATGLAVVAGVLLARKLETITFADMGSFKDNPIGEQAPWHHEEGPNLAFWEAGKQKDLCGIVMVGTPLISTGGYSYLHKNVPILQWAYGDIAQANYYAAPRMTPPPPGWRLVAGFPDYVLFKRDGGCAPSPWFVQEFPR